MLMFLYFIRLKDRFVSTFEDKLSNILNVTRIEQASVEGNPKKAERSFRNLGSQHTMLIVRVQGEKGAEEVEHLLDAGKTLDAIYHYEKCKLVD